jgi:hypothetical protein
VTAGQVVTLTVGGAGATGDNQSAGSGGASSVVVAGTHPINVTYSDFHIIQRDVPFYPDAMRISGFQSHMASRLNEPRIEFTHKEMEMIYQKIILNIEGNNKPKTIKLIETKLVSYS